MKILVLTLCTVFSLGAFAQDRETLRLKKRIERVSLNIADEARFSEASKEELKEALDYLKLVKEIVYGLEPTPTYSAMQELKCVARDNDNSAPFVFARITDDFDIVKITAAAFRSMNSCEGAKTNTRAIETGELFCVSRDGDDSAPFQIGKYVDNKITKSNKVTFRSNRNCLNAIQSNLMQKDRIVFCTARDGDNSAPFVISFIDTVSGEVSVKRSTTFTSMNECLRVIENR